jgi:polysaccharide deacetylase family protein (PEP-CTERM system associated)
MSRPAGVRGSVLNALTFDVEEWFHTILFKNGTRAGGVSSLPENISDILGILDRHSTKATFFILGAVAEAYPETVRLIHSKGHEIASHGYLHKLVYRLTRNEFEEDVGRSLDVLGRFTGQEISGYRAPTWSILKDTDWAIDVLKKSGLRYDSSIYPSSINLFECNKLKIMPYEITRGFVEFPPPIFKFLGYNLPFAGGVFLRLFSERLIVNKIRQLNHTGVPVLTYFHSWEFDRDLPRMDIPAWKHFIQCSNLSSVRIKLELLLREFRFGTVKDVLLGNGMIG